MDTYSQKQNVDIILQVEQLFINLSKYLIKAKINIEKLNKRLEGNVVRMVNKAVFKLLMDLFFVINYIFRVMLKVKFSFISKLFRFKTKRVKE